MISQSKYFGNTFYDVQGQKSQIGVSSMKIFDGEDLSKQNLPPWGSPYSNSPGKPQKDQLAPVEAVVGPTGQGEVADSSLGQERVEVGPLSS